MNHQSIQKLLPDPTKSTQNLNETSLPIIKEFCKFDIQENLMFIVLILVINMYLHIQ